MSDLALLQRWRTQNDAAAFNAIASRYAGMVYATCLRVLGNASDAEDVAQECFQVLALTSEGPREHVGGWLHAVATNRSLKRLREEKRRKRREAEFASLYETHDEIEWDDVYEQVDEAIEDLPEKLRIPVVAHFLQGESHAAISERLGLSRRGVTHRIERGLEHVRKALKRKGVLVPSAALAAAMKGSSAAAAPPGLSTAIGRLAIAVSVPRSSAGVVSSSAGITSQMALYGGIVMMTKKILVTLGVLAVVVGASYLFLAPSRGPVSERQAMNTAFPGERPQPLSPEKTGEGESEPRAPQQEGAGSTEIQRADANRAERASGRFSFSFENLMESLKQRLNSDEEDLDAVESSDIPPDNGAHYFLLAAELFPEVDRDWLLEKLKEIRLTGTSEDPELLDFLAKCRASFDAIRQGLDVGDAELPPGRYGLAEPLPYLPAYRNLSYAMCLEAEMLAAQGQYADALAMYDTLLDFGTECGRGGFTLHAIVGWNNEGVAVESLSYAIDSRWATPDEYRFLIEQLQTADTRQYRLSEAMMAEERSLALWGNRLRAEDEAAFTSEIVDLYGLIEGRQDDLSEMTSGEIEALYGKILADYERMAAYFALPYYEAQRTDTTALLDDNWVVQIDPVEGRTAGLNGGEARMAASVRGLTLMTAVELYRVENETYPETLTQLVPDYLESLPEDPFSGNAFGYTAGPTDYVLYSAGPDMRDDGGVVCDPTGHFVTWQGDWVIHGENASIRRIS